VSDKPQNKETMDEPVLARRIGIQARRKLEAKRAQRDSNRIIGAGLSAIGFVGWSVVLPTVIGTALGVWLDRHYPMSHSWALTLLFAGLFAGCLNAWRWIAKEDKDTHEQRKEPHG
jgi:ATP synthase protein I